MLHVLHSLGHLLHGSSELAPLAAASFPVVTLERLRRARLIEAQMGRRVLFHLRVELKLRRSDVLAVRLLRQSLVDGRIIGFFPGSDLGFVQRLIFIYLGLSLSHARVVFVVHVHPQVDVVHLGVEVAKLLSLHINLRRLIQRVRLVLHGRHETVENLDVVLRGQALGLLRHLKESIRWLISVLLSKPPRKEIACRVRLSDLLRA